jgi:hypothetical protein
MILFGKNSALEKFKRICHYSEKKEFAGFEIFTVIRKSHFRKQIVHQMGRAASQNDNSHHIHLYLKPLYRFMSDIYYVYCKELSDDLI